MRAHNLALRTSVQKPSAQQDEIRRNAAILTLRVLFTLFTATCFMMAPPHSSAQPLQKPEPIPPVPIPGPSPKPLPPSPIPAPAPKPIPPAPPHLASRFPVALQQMTRCRQRKCCTHDVPFSLHGSSLSAAIDSKIETSDVRSSHMLA